MNMVEREHIVFIMMMTHDPVKAQESYRRATGKPATLIVIRPDFHVSSESTLLARSRRGAASVMLVTHMATPVEWLDREDSDHVQRLIHRQVENSTDLVNTPDSKVVPKPIRGKPERGGGICPHCKGRIADFNEIGFWWGWERGIVPPYWEELREFVFRRDQYTCHLCHSRLPASKLNAHHIDPKEDGGIDGARNLQTLCLDCHADLHPIYPLTEES